MKLQIFNLGAIKAATIDLGKKLTVFCGPNGTGKTYAAYVIYALTNGGNIGFGISRDVRNFDLEDLLEIGETTIKVSSDVIYRFREVAFRRTSVDASGIFALPDSKVKEFLSGFNITTSESQQDFAQHYISLALSFEANYRDYIVTVTKVAGDDFLHIKSHTPVNIPRTVHPSIITQRLLQSIIGRLAFFPITKSTILPVERNSINTFSKELSLEKQSLVDQLQELASKGGRGDRAIGRLVREIPRYTLPVRDALLVAEDIAEISKQQSPYFDFAVDLEQSILKGEITVSKDGQVLFASNQAREKKLSFHISSASVKTITSLVLYLKHQAQENDLIIVDEPELNLHPNNQILLARIFARLVNKGLRLLISTHSDYIIRELNNLIMLGEPQPALKKVASELGYKADENLAREEVGVYLFHLKRDEQNVTVEQVSIEQNGFEISTIEETINSLNSVSEEIFFTLKYGDQTSDDAA